MTITATIIKDSISPDGIRLTTMHLRYPRFIHAEVMTHRKFCLAGDARLDFELPAGTHRKGNRRIHSMSLREFADKWLNGAAKSDTSRHNGKKLDHLDAARFYSASEIATELGMRSVSNLNKICREGNIFGAHKRGREWVAYGRYWMDWRAATGTRRYSMKSRLSAMRIRQINEHTGEVVTSTVKDCFISGEKEIFRVSAGSFSVCGSKDHRILTASGWKRIEEIEPGVDQVIAYRYGSGANSDINRYNKIDGRWVQTWARQNRKTVADRQKGICAIGGDVLEKGFHLHHIQPRHERPDLAFDLDNVIAVNPKAHASLHEKQGWQVGVTLGSQPITVDAVTSEGLCDTYDLEIAGEFPNFFADGIVVHNSRNARSSRAVPVKKLASEETFTPHFMQNCPGMQSREEMDSETRAKAESVWRRMIEETQKGVIELAELGVAKQWANRPLEWFTYIDVLVSATEWANWFWLRDHDDAQPEIQELARCMRAAMDTSTPEKLRADEWHLPYIDKAARSDAWIYLTAGPKPIDMPKTQKEADKLLQEMLIKMSVARCARISYKHFDGESSVEKDLALYDKLVGSSPLHASPAEHQAYADEKRLFVSGEKREWRWDSPELHGNFTGWCQHRKMLEGEFVSG